MSKVKLSVIVPIYNEEVYLHQCVSSILNQTYTNLEIILVDDGSTDSSPSICDELAESDSRIKVIHQSNQGMINSRYSGVKMAKGEYVTFCDADDFVSEEAYDFLLDKAVAYKADIVLSGIYRYYGAERKVMDPGSIIDEGLYIESDIREKIVPVMLWEKKRSAWGIDPSLCTKVFRKELIQKQYEKACCYSFSFGEDSVIIYPLILSSQRVYVSHSCFYYHRQREKGEIAPYISDRNFPDEALKLYKYLENIFLKNSQRDVLIRQLDMFYIRAVKYISSRYPEVENKQEVAKNKIWIFPFAKVETGSKIVLYGAGKVGRILKKQLEVSDYCKEVLWVDQNPPIDLPSVYKIDTIKREQYDYIVIAIENMLISEGIKQKLMEEGWKKSQIIVSNYQEQCIYV